MIRRGSPFKHFITTTPTQPPMIGSEPGTATQPSSAAHPPPPSSQAKPTAINNENNSKPKKTRGRPADSPDVTLSKTLSYILRHGALKERLVIRADGCIRLDDLLKRPKLKNYTIDDVRRVVAENEKQRFALVDEQAADGSIVNYIRANQGHSIKEVDQPDLTPLIDPIELPTVVHGTYSKFWDSIAQDGLKPMSRTHIHFAKGLLGEEGVISGMRASCDTFIYLDVEKCLQAQIEFFLSSNGVILSEGLPASKSIPAQYFKKVVDKHGTVLYPPQ
ncbi:uncharacterized protein PGTG_02199 [Puccinia graminis f. sp. tritici CRL 75-36-700-3]|uniref:2'-phosphotransferase n=1 Tax=Puccinia graminis f. sp. tritici (strain CRL 75-36-700-3 / race SCCL) TaxID=418459 RepID=E3JXG3_PUCGT|nr:uncharacterized protein PGTG_02199 [Puccinia graminis f. sp. tritici CRL 75-36-700-3]EFP76738.2 hypothetical protein PGTG_02199 [Puccinia graminis f. sp. tritici CRL 75-36-700-3]